MWARFTQAKHCDHEKLTTSPLQLFTVVTLCSGMSMLVQLCLDIYTNNFRWNDDQTWIITKQSSQNYDNELNEEMLEFILKKMLNLEVELLSMRLFFFLLF